ncbi:hypothetical protein [Streptomyces hokutonensis]|uniref:Uncharacterized protein n=1 Tax=Streptomyces hokutonensis TaxID=1306990 RepID=A0ABW6M5X0_9ACTN
MRTAFQPHRDDKQGGPLADAGAEPGEQEATAALFAGTIGAYKNPRESPHSRLRRPH